MTTLFRVRLLPAGHGDCIILEYGDDTAPRRILIDGGTEGTSTRLDKVLDRLGRKLELVVVSHVDADHIAGMLSLVDGHLKPIEFDDFWFNGYRHLTGLEEMGPVQGEKLTTWLLERHAPWNLAFAGKAVAIPDDAHPVVKTLPGGMRLTLLSPTFSKLRALKGKWEDECRKAGLDPAHDQVQVQPPPPGLEPMGPIDVQALAAMPFQEDQSEANGSSIAFLAEYEGRSLLLAADAHPGVLAAAIGKLPGGSAKVGAFKTSHHASKYSTSPALLSMVDTRRYLISTNGAYFKHPDREAIARILVQKVPECELRFNSRSAYTEIWESDALQGEWGYTPVLPDGNEGAVLEL